MKWFGKMIHWDIERHNISGTFSDTVLKGQSNGAGDHHVI